jgi:hypothetical protein
MEDLSSRIAAAAAVLLLCLSCGSNRTYIIASDIDTTTDRDYGMPLGGAGELHNYQGDIGDEERVPIGVTLVFDGSDVSGCLYYHSDLRDRPLEGSIDDERGISFSEVDERGRVVSVFEGRFLADNTEDPRGHFGEGYAPLQREIIVGSWRRPGEDEVRPFYLCIDNITHAGEGGRYGAISADYEVMERSAQEFWFAIRDEDRESVADCMRYPLRVNESSGSREISNREELLLRYDSIFTEDYVQAILRHVPHNMFVNYQGVMLGNGEVWFCSNGKVMVLNTSTYR